MCLFYCTTVHTNASKLNVKVDVCFDWRNERRKLFLRLSLNSLPLSDCWYSDIHSRLLTAHWQTYLVTHQLLTDCATLYYQDTAPAATAAQLRSESWHLFTCSPPPPPPLFTDPHTGAPLKTTFYRFWSNVVIVFYSNCHAKLQNTGVQFLHYNPYSVHYN